MKKLIAYINSLDEAGRMSFASRVGTSIGYMRKRVSIGRPLSAERCVAIERETNGVITRKDLRPNDYRLIWPDLIGRRQGGRK